MTTERNSESFTNESISVFVPVKPVPKGRPRMTRRGRVFTPQRTIDAETLVRTAWETDQSSQVQCRWSSTLPPMAH